jgi:hypothetical protein
MEKTMRSIRMGLVAVTLVVGGSTAALAQGYGYRSPGHQGDFGDSTYGSNQHYDQAWRPNQKWFERNQNRFGSHGGQSFSYQDATNLYGDRGDQFSQNRPGYRGKPNEFGGGQLGTDYDSGGQSVQGSQFARQSRSTQRMALRRLLRKAGFQNVRIVDSLFLVQARTPDGNQVLMAVNPPNRSSQGFVPGSVQSDSEED